MSFPSGLSDLFHRSKHVWSSLRHVGFGHEHLRGFSHGSGLGIGHGIGGGIWEEGIWWDWLRNTRSMMFWLALVLLFVIIATILNPDENSFKSHLTELSFRRHLALIHSRPDHVQGEEDDKDSPAPFRFSNHVAISLRTPQLLYRAMFLYSVVITSPLAPPTFLDAPKAKSNAESKDGTVVWIGILGHWYYLGECAGVWGWYWRRMAERGGGKKGKRKVNGVRAGVLDMKVVMAKEDVSGRSAPSTPATKLLRKSDSIASLTDLSLTLPLHTPPQIRSRRPSIGHSSSATPHSPPVTEADSPLITSLKTDLTSIQSVLVDLRAQLAARDMNPGDISLQNTLDELRHKRKEDDAERQEIKSRTKTLEEQKRQAEGARKEAEKKHRSVEHARTVLENKITSVISDTQGYRDRMTRSAHTVKRIENDGKRHTEVIHQNIHEKKQEVTVLEDELNKLEDKNEGLSKNMKDAVERLKMVQEAEHNRNLNPEEEMMMMAAAYEAAAQEGYHHGIPTTQTQAQAQGIWTNQAAQYMAEAGFPHLDANYTSRPIQIKPVTDKQFPASSITPPSSINLTSTNPIPSFIPSNHSSSIPTFIPSNSVDQPLVHSTSSVNPVDPSHTVTSKGKNNLILANDRSSTPVDREIEEDPGSPSSLSTFSTNLLPQGLFRSLEGETSTSDLSRSSSPTTMKHESMSYPSVLKTYGKPPIPNGILAGYYLPGEKPFGDFQHPLEYIPQSPEEPLNFDRPLQIFNPPEHPNGPPVRSSMEYYQTHGHLLGSGNGNIRNGDSGSDSGEDWFTPELRRQTTPPPPPPITSSDSNPNSIPESPYYGFPSPATYLRIKAREPKEKPSQRSIYPLPPSGSYYDLIRPKSTDISNVRPRWFENTNSNSNPTTSNPATSNTNTNINGNSTDNLSFRPFHSTNSNDSLNLPYESSPFAPSASEKQALSRWGGSIKYPWTGNSNQPSNEKYVYSLSSTGLMSSPDVIRSSSRSTVVSTGQKNIWTRLRGDGDVMNGLFGHGIGNKNVIGNGSGSGSGNGNGNGIEHGNGNGLGNTTGHEVGQGSGTGGGSAVLGGERLEKGEEKKPFSFFSLRKPSQSVQPGNED
ncbi:hypothetical protein TREMEDRAFT_58148 [Tremella mesenterica DSM 1558]|uniref:uncharacterized protein n=1 Tax=Tremella mesenterica (strain ATCC 24925 / CBS 8224 / DSM 1558 / NBRC 9311 / NRRL Y-6157 / RJB 2259-6 / UBC 559-6) TaxID=578456 RepID=UPI0003F49B5C|nr:uncharacterized protein TREMEDRAFT_58148 [Tremella mesenterica DSM 1558]EIW72006.1 hypothetical protein TREMEDRAFT_58148 [Tremella mesenterica DSM 1558]